jgi:hypothetical protein
VGGEGVAVVEVAVGRVGGREAYGVAAVELHVDGAVSEVDDLAAVAVDDVQVAVVVAEDDAVTFGERAIAEDDVVASEAAGVAHVLAGALVEV